MSGAHDHGLVEQTACEGRLAESSYRTAAGTLTENHNVIGVSTELLYILLYPLEGLDLVHNNSVVYPIYQVV